MYSVILFLHSWGRWLLLGLMLVVLFRSYTGWMGKKDYTESDGKLRLLTVIFYDLQIVIGVYLYTFLSPTVRAAFQSMGEAMKDSQLRFFVIEHTFGMLLAVAALHVGNVFAKKAQPGAAQHKVVAIMLTVVVLITLASIPWPGLPYGRVLFRGF